MIVRDMIEHLEHCIEQAEQDAANPMFPAYEGDLENNRQFISECQRDIERFEKMPMDSRLTVDEVN